MIPAPTTTSEASRDQFLSLLVTQIRHQDPLEPVAQDQFIAQLAQFSTLEGIEKLNGNFELMLEANQSMARMNELTQGETLIGRTVRYGEGGLAQGKVEAVEFSEGSIRVVVDGNSIPLDRVDRISE